MPQLPPLQVAVPLVTSAHLVLQPPQWFGSVFVSVQVELNALHFTPQPPFTQQPPLHEEATQPASGVVPVSGAPLSGTLPSSPDESGTAVSSAASLPPSSPESVPVVPSSPEEPEEEELDEDEEPPEDEEGYGFVASWTEESSPELPLLLPLPVTPPPLLPRSGVTTLVSPPLAQPVDSAEATKTAPRTRRPLSIFMFFVFSKTPAQ
jgi:hypothetical protein